VLDVVFAGKRLRRIGLAAKRTRRAQVVNLASFPEARTGRLVLRVGSQGRPVRVEGIGAALA
jgi:hypothetical protein